MTKMMIEKKIVEIIIQIVIIIKQEHQVQFVPPQNVTLDAQFPELLKIATPNELVILDGSGSTGTITSWSIVPTGGQPTVTLQDVPSKQYSKQFIMPNTTDILTFDLTIRNDQTGQEDTATTIVVSNQTLALLACSGETITPTNFLTYSNVENNFVIPYPEEFFLKPGDSGKSTDPFTPGNPTEFNYTIPADPDCISPLMVSRQMLNIH